MAETWTVDDDEETQDRKKQIHALVDQILAKTREKFNSRTGIPQQVLELAEQWEKELYAAIEPPNLRYYYDHLKVKERYNPYRALYATLENLTKVHFQYLVKEIKEGKLRRGTGTYIIRDNFSVETILTECGIAKRDESAKERLDTCRSGHSRVSHRVAAMHHRQVQTLGPARYGGLVLV